MRKRFYFALSITFWLFMVVGFSDNWLFDVGQASNSDPRFLVHAFFASSWFSLLVVQTGLIQRRNARLHMKLGVAGMFVFAGLLLSTLPMYLEEYLEDGSLDALSTMVFAQLVFATILIGVGFAKRKTDLAVHRTNIMFGSFMLIQPAVDRAVGHLFGSVGLAWLIIYLVLFGLFIWYHRRLPWQVAAGFGVWAGGLILVLASLG